MASAALFTHTLPPSFFLFLPFISTNYPLDSPLSTLSLHFILLADLLQMHFICSLSINVAALGTA